MCKLYADWSPRRSSSTLNRSHSFSGGDTSHEKDAEKEGSFFENSTKEQSEVVGEETTEKILYINIAKEGHVRGRLNNWLFNLCGFIKIIN